MKIWPKSIAKKNGVFCRACMMLVFSSIEEHPRGFIWWEFWLTGVLIFNIIIWSWLFIMQIFLTTTFVRKIQDGDNFHFSYFLFKFTFYISFRVYKLFFLNTPVSWSFPVRKLKKCPKSEKFRINCQICIFPEFFKIWRWYDMVDFFAFICC